MHAPVDLPPSNDVQIINLRNATTVPLVNQLNICDLVHDKIADHERFFGIEISPGYNYALDYNIFKIVPLFTSIVWIAGNNLQYDPIMKSPALQLADRTQINGPVLQHISAHNLTKTKLGKILENAKNNFMAIRGDIVQSGQHYLHAADLVRDIRKIRKDNVCISVGGYPDVHPEAVSREQDLLYLKEKVDSGADMIITQVSFSLDKILAFIRDCRAMGISVPIIPGIYVPYTYSGLKFMTNITKVYPSAEDMKEYKRRKYDPKEFRDYAVQQAIKLIRGLFDSDLGIYGLQFFTTNHFDHIAKIVDEVF